MQHVKNGIKRSHPLRLIGFAVGMLLFIFLAFDAATRAEDPKLVEGQPRSSALSTENILLVGNDFYLNKATAIDRKNVPASSSEKTIRTPKSESTNANVTSKLQKQARELPEAASEKASQAIETSSAKGSSRGQNR